MAYSSAYSKWYAILRTALANTIYSSTDGQNWTRATSPAYANAWGVISAGSNPILLVANSGENASTGSTAYYLKSTDGSTWATASDIRGFRGQLYGLQNGYFVKFNLNTQGGYYITTDPTSLTGTAWISASGFTAISSCGASAPTSTGRFCIWGAGPSSTNIYTVGGANPTTAGSAYDTGFAIGTYGFPRAAIYNPADDLFYMVTETGHLFSTTGYNTGVNYVTQIISGASSDWNLAYFNGFVYASLSVSGSNEYNFVAPATNISSGFVGYNIPGGSNTYPNYGYTVPVSTAYRPSRFAASSTRLLSYNGYNSVSIIDSNDPLTLKFYPQGIYHYQRLNGTDVMYGGINATAQSQYGIYQSSNMTTTIPSLYFYDRNWGGDNAYYWNKNNYIAYIGSKYYITSSSAIFIGSTISGAVSNSISTTSVNGESWTNVDVSTEIVGAGSGAYLFPQQNVSNTANMQMGYTNNIANAVNNSYMTGSIVQID
jgi:hypothetical protein